MCKCFYTFFILFLYFCFMIAIKIRIEGKIYRYDSLQELFDSHVIENRKGKAIKSYQGLYKAIKRGEKFKNCKIWV